MSAASPYRLADEPRGALHQRLTVRPIFPLFAIMIAGCWFSWPWTVLNAFAFGSPTRLREVLLVVVGFAVNILASVTIFGLLAAEAIEPPLVPYLLILLTGWKLAVSYTLYLWQSRTFGIYEYFGGPVAQGGIGLVIAFVLSMAVEGFFGQNAFLMGLYTVVLR